MKDSNAIFFILYGAMVVDDAVHENEVALLYAFLNHQMIVVDLNLDDEMLLLRASKEYSLRMLQAAIEHFQSRDLETKISVLRLVSTMIKMDGKIEDTEISFLTNIGETWGINVPTIINDLLR